MELVLARVSEVQLVGAAYQGDESRGFVAPFVVGAGVIVVTFSLLSLLSLIGSWRRSVTMPFFLYMWSRPPVADVTIPAAS